MHQNNIDTLKHFVIDHKMQQKTSLQCQTGAKNRSHTFFVDNRCSVEQHLVCHKSLIVNDHCTTDVVQIQSNNHFIDLTLSTVNDANAIAVSASLTIIACVTVIIIGLLVKEQCYYRLFCNKSSNAESDRKSDNASSKTTHSTIVAKNSAMITK